MPNSFSPAEWRAYYWKSASSTNGRSSTCSPDTDARQVLEIGPAYGLVTAMLANAGYEVRPSTS